MEESEVGSEWGALGEAHGRALGHCMAQATALLRVLRDRFGPLPEELLGGVWSTTDTDRLRGWVQLAATAPDLLAFRSQAGV